MEKVIVYKQANGKIAICVPTPEFLENNTIEDVIAKDIPAGVEYEVVNKNDLPDLMFRDAWEFQK